MRKRYINHGYEAYSAYIQPAFEVKGSLILYKPRAEGQYIKTHGWPKQIAKSKTCDKLQCIFNTSEHFHNMMS